MARLTEAQERLLADLAALEDAGMIYRGGKLDLWHEVSNGETRDCVDAEPVVTPAGRALLSERARGDTNGRS